MEPSTPSLACDSCGASVPLSRVTRRGGYLRSIECPDCGAVMTWSLATDDDIDLRERTVSDEKDANEIATRRHQDR
jgi:uncharacterized Zn finger protein